MATDARLKHKASLSSILKLSPRKHTQHAPAADENVSPTAEPVGFVKGLLRRVSSSSHSHEAKKRSKQAEEEREPFRSFLRVRPPPSDRTSVPSFVETVSDTEVKLHAPDNPSTNSILGVRSTPGLLPSTNFSFTRVFGADTTQPDFFQETALPLVQDVLDGTSGLLFAYGVSNSGKTYTVQGGPQTGEPGILPRAVDVVFNSIAEKHSLANVRPSKLDSVESIPVHERTPQFRTHMHDVDITSENKHRCENMAHDATVLKVSDAYTYAVWVSYIEVYNEKVYDLLEAPEKVPSPPGQMPGTFSAMSLNTLAVTNPTSPQETAQKGGDVKRKALSLKHDKESGNKYVSGATEVRVWSADDARAIMRKGQINRRVYGTMLNRTSSRSHSIFTIKVVRMPVHAVAGGELAASSRLCIVDLAGSERTRNAQTSGERLKEAGNINKSLMVLGQCLEVIRQNQLRDKGKKPQQVPFRHSKLTELFQSFFMGQGRAAMVVCLNPYDTGYEESMHVMKFSAMAKEVTTSKALPAEPVAVVTAPKPAPLPYQHPRAASPPAVSPPLGPSRSASPVKRPPLQPTRGTRENTPGLRESTPAPEMFFLAPEHRIVTRENTPAPFRESTPAPDDFVLAPEPQTEDEEEDDQEEDGFVDFLLDEIRSLRVQLVECQIESAAVEARVRQDVVRDFTNRMQEMERSFAERSQAMMDAAERKYDAKIAILQKAHDAILACYEDEDVEVSDEEEDEEPVEEDAEQLQEPESPTRQPEASTSARESILVPEPAAQPPPAEPEVIDVDALSDADIPTSPRLSQAVTAPDSVPEAEPAPEMTVEEPTPAPAAKALRKSTRKSTRKSAAATADAETTPVKTGRKSRAPPVGVRDRIKMLEAMMQDDGSGDEGSVVLEAGKTAGKKKRKPVGKTRDTDALEAEEEPAPSRPPRGPTRGQTGRTVRGATQRL